MPEYLRSHGVPEDEIGVFRRESQTLLRMVRFVRDPEPLAAEDTVDGWEVLHLPGHADGHLALLRDGVLIAGDTLLASITPNVGLYPDARPDPLGDYLASLKRIEGRSAVAYAGHGEPIADPAGRARELISHHHDRLEQAAEGSSDEPRTAYELSFALWPEPLPPALRRFALAETHAHVEYLVLRDAATRAERNGRVEFSSLS